MGTVCLVRHGQASFGAADYDRLSDLGHRQCERLGAHWARQGRRFERVMSGTLRRHRESLDAIARGMADSGCTLPLPTVLPGLNEYDADAMVRAFHPAPLPPQSSPAETARLHFRLLRQALLGWMSGSFAPADLPSHTEFQAGVAEALELALQWHRENVLIVSSGGPIAVALGLVLDLPGPAVVALNMALRNSAVSELTASSQRHGLLTFNTLPHLEDPGLPDWVTHA